MGSLQRTLKKIQKNQVRCVSKEPEKFFNKSTLVRLLGTSDKSIQKKDWMT